MNAPSLALLLLAPITWQDRAPTLAEIELAGRELEVVFWRGMQTTAPPGAESVRAFRLENQRRAEEIAASVLDRVPPPSELDPATLTLLLEKGFAEYADDPGPFFDRAMALSREPGAPESGELAVLAFGLSMALDERAQAAAVERLANHPRAASALRDPRLWASFAWARVQPALIREHFDGLVRLGVQLPGFLELEGMMGAIDLFRLLSRAAPARIADTQVFRENLLTTLRNSEPALDRAQHYAALSWPGGSPAGYLRREIEFLEGTFAKGELIGRAAPPLEFAWVSGNLPWRALEDLRGRVVVLDFWTTSCVPCRKKFPELREVAAHFVDDSVVLLGVSSIADEQDRDHQSFGWMAAFIEEQGMTWPVALARRSVFNPDYGVQSIPHVTIVGADGTVLQNDVEYETASELIRRIETVLREQERGG